MTTDELIAAADLCVKCGLCLPHCPTYQKTRNENESPRGRIGLIQAWANDDLPDSENLWRHVDRCLLCRSCEQACPAQVPYAELVDNFRRLTVAHKHDSTAEVWLKRICHQASVNRFGRKALPLLQTGGLKNRLEATGLARRLGLGALESMLPDKPAGQGLTQAYYPADTPKRGEVALFAGCLGRMVDGRSLDAAITLLNRCGYTVHIPDNQVCCGALALHDGDHATAAALAQTNARVFAQLPVEAVISCASGCGASLQEYPNAFGEDSSLTVAVFDIGHFLHRSKLLSERSFQPLTERVLVHQPCTLRNVMGSDASVSVLIRQIPELEIVSLPETIVCCGAAGSYMLKYPDMAQALLEDVMAGIESLAPTLLLSSNIGCSLHIRAGLKQRGIDLEVLHPVELLLRQWPE